MSFSSFLNDMYPNHPNETQQIDMFLQSNDSLGILVKHKEQVSDNELSAILNQAILRLCHANLDDALTHKYMNAVGEIVSFISSEKREARAGDAFLLAWLDDKQELINLLLPVRPNGYCCLESKTDLNKKHEKSIGQSFLYISINAFLTMKDEDGNIDIAINGLNHILHDFDENNELNAQFTSIFNNIFKNKDIEPKEIYQRILRLNECIRVHLLSAALFAAVNSNRVSHIKPLLEMGALIYAGSYHDFSSITLAAINMRNQRGVFLELLRQMSLNNRLLSIPNDCKEPAYKCIKTKPNHTNSPTRIESDCILFQAFLYGDFEIFELLLNVGYPVQPNFFDIIKAQHHYVRDGHSSKESDAILDRFHQLLLNTIPNISNRIRLFKHASYELNSDSMYAYPHKKACNVADIKSIPEKDTLFLKILNDDNQYEASGTLSKDLGRLMLYAHLLDNQLLGALLNKAVVAQFKSNLDVKIKNDYQSVIDAILLYLKKSNRAVSIGDGFILAILSHHQELVEQLSSYKPRPECTLTQGSASHTPYTLCAGMNLLDIAIVDYGECPDEEKEKAKNYVYSLLQSGAKPGIKTFGIIKKYYNDEIFFLTVNNGLLQFTERDEELGKNYKFLNFIDNRFNDLISISAPAISFLKFFEIKHLSKKFLHSCLDELYKHESLLKDFIDNLDDNNSIHRILAHLAFRIAFKDNMGHLFEPLIDKGAFKDDPYDLLYVLETYNPFYFNETLFKRLIKILLEKKPDLFNHPTEKSINLLCVFIRHKDFLDELNLFLKQYQSYPKSDICLLGYAFKCRNINAFKALYSRGLSPSKATSKILTEDYLSITKTTVVDYSKCQFFNQNNSCGADTTCSATSPNPDLK